MTPTMPRRRYPWEDGFEEQNGAPPPMPSMERSGPPPMPGNEQAPPQMRQAPPEMETPPPLPPDMSQQAPPINVTVAPRPQSAPPPMPRTGAMFRRMDQMQQQKAPPVWRQALGAVAAASPRLRALSPLISGESGRAREMENLKLAQAGANEEQQVVNHEQDRALRGRQIDLTDEQKRLALDQRALLAKKPQTPAEQIQLWRDAGYSDDQAKQIVMAGGKLQPQAAPRPTVVPPGSTALGPDGKPIYESSKPSKADDLAETVAAKTEIADKQGLKGAERQHFIYGTPMPSAAAGGSAGVSGGLNEQQDKALRTEAAKNPTLDYDAWTYMIERRFNVRGMGKEATAGAERIKARAGQIMSDLKLDPGELFGRGAQLKGNLGAYAKVSSFAAQIEAFEGTLLRNAKIAEKLSADYARGDLRLYNRVLSAFKTGKGDQEALNLAAQLHGLSREWGKIMAGSTSSVGVPISEANAADEFFAKGISNGQLKSLIDNVIIPDAHSRTAANEEQKAKLIDGIRGLTSGPSSNPPPQQGGTVGYQVGPDHYDIPAARVADFLKSHPTAVKK